MKYLAAIALAAAATMPLAAQGQPALSVNERITCSALLFLSSEGADDPSTEQMFAAHHLSKAIEASGGSQETMIALVETQMQALRPAWEQGDADVMETYGNCIRIVFEEFES